VRRQRRLAAHAQSQVIFGITAQASLYRTQACIALRFVGLRRSA
jgi:hypothetical protein